MAACKNFIAYLQARKAGRIWKIFKDLRLRPKQFAKAA